MSRINVVMWRVSADISVYLKQSSYQWVNEAVLPAIFFFLIRPESRFALQLTEDYH